MTPRARSVATRRRLLRALQRRGIVADISTCATGPLYDLLTLDISGHPHRALVRVVDGAVYVVDDGSAADLETMVPVPKRADAFDVGSFCGAILTASAARGSDPRWFDLRDRERAWGVPAWIPLTPIRAACAW